jgi:hypothetical protein
LYIDLERQTKGFIMNDRWGIQDHDRQSGRPTMQNPTNQGNFQNISGGGGDYPQSTQFQGSTANFTIWDVIKMLWKAPPVQRPKSLVKAVLLALIFGPIGLAYASRRGALVIFGLLVLAGALSGGMRGLDNESVMGPLWQIAAVASVAWAVIATRAFNARLENPGGVPGVDKPL